MREGEGTAHDPEGGDEEEFEERGQVSDGGEILVSIPAQQRRELSERRLRLFPFLQNRERFPSEPGLRFEEVLKVAG